MSSAIGLGGTLRASTSLHGGKRDSRIKSANYLVTMVDLPRPARFRSIDEEQMSALEERMNAKGYLKAAIWRPPQQGARQRSELVLRSSQFPARQVAHSRSLIVRKRRFDALPAEMPQLYMRNSTRRIGWTNRGASPRRRFFWPIDLRKVKKTSFFSVGPETTSPLAVDHAHPDLKDGQFCCRLGATSPACKSPGSKSGHWENDQKPADPRGMGSTATAYHDSWWQVRERWISTIRRAVK